MTNQEALSHDMDDIKHEQKHVILELSEMKSIISELKTDIRWIRETMDNINDRFESCSSCNNSEYLISQTKANQKVLGDVKDSVGKIKYTAAGVSLGVSIVVAVLSIAWSIRMS